MNPKDHQKVLAKWTNWLEEASKSIGMLVFNDWIFRKSMVFAESEAAVDPGNLFYQWTQRIYMRAALIGIRHHLDTRDGTYSLRALLIKIGAHPQVVTKESFASHYRTELREAGREYFGQVAGTCGACLPADFAEGDLKSLTTTGDLLLPVINQAVAHLDQNQSIDVPIKWQDVHDAISLLDRLAVKYQEILTASKPMSETLLPCNMDDYEDEVLWLWGSPSTRREINSVD